ncbi:MAG TPA: hypothetical protein VFL93_16990 [Longimicrobiaceae bacterium]|nr:hypothetical protein [Longimicrobiaceae bacterium]
MADREPGFEARLGDAPATVLFAERLRDGRIALGSRVERRDGTWESGDLQLLEPRAWLDLAAWLSPLVEEAWAATVQDRQGEPLRTAADLYGEGQEGVARLAIEMVQQIPPALLARAMLLLANSIGPEARERLVHRLNETTIREDDIALRRRMAEEHEAFAYAVAAAALFDALARGVPEDD